MKREILPCPILAGALVTSSIAQEEEIKFNFESGTNKSSGDVFIPFDILFGKMLNKKTVFSVEFAAPIYKDSGYDFYDWKLGARIGFFF